MPESSSLTHYGVMGMKWGQRKARPTGPAPAPMKVKDTPHKFGADGSLTIPQGAVIQRMVGPKTIFNKGPAQVLSDGPTYASFLARDKLEYEQNFGFQKGLIAKESSRAVGLRAKVALKAPSPAKASELFFDELKKHPEDIKRLQNYGAGTYISKKSIERALANPKTLESYRVYAEAFDGSSYVKSLGGINDNFIKRLNKEGFNMVIDAADSDFMGVYDTPVAILNGNKTLELSSQRVVDKVSKVLVKDAIKEYDKINTGQQYIDKYILPNLK